MGTKLYRRRYLHFMVQKEFFLKKVKIHKAKEAVK
jgi:hypothetical protein